MGCLRSRRRARRPLTSAASVAGERQRPAPGLIHHSDRGIQYASEAYRGALATAGITPSMSRKVDCWDNAHGELLPYPENRAGPCRLYAARADARGDLLGYIEGFYNPRRLHLGYMSPAEMERRAA